MKLLDPQSVKAGKDKDDYDRIVRVQKLNTEGTAIVKRVNALREYEKAETKRLDDLVQKKRNESATEIAELDTKIFSRRSELAELLKPLDDQKEAIKKWEEQVAESAADILRRDMSLDEREEVLSERVEAIADREAENVERHIAMDTRESNLEKAEERHKESEKSLAERWVDYHKAVGSAYAREIALARAEKEVADAKSANDAVRETQTKAFAEIAADRRAVKDGYTALEQAKRHLGVK